MYNLDIILRVFFIFFLMAIAAVYIDIQFPETCTYKCEGTDRSAHDRRDKKEKGMIFCISVLTATIITAITAFIFNFLDKPPYNIVTISSLVLGIGGAIFIAYSTRIENVTYEDSYNRNPMNQYILRQKSKSLFLQTGSYFIVGGLGLQLLYFIQQI